MDDPSDELPFVDILQEVRNMTAYEKQRCLDDFMYTSHEEINREELEQEEGD